MLIKTIIVLLLLGLIISLASGLVFLFKDVEVAGSRRTLHSLGVRITLAAALMATIVVGFATGQLGVGAPWDARKYSDAAPPGGAADAGLQDIDEDKQADPDNIDKVPVP